MPSFNNRGTCKKRKLTWQLLIILGNTVGMSAIKPGNLLMKHLPDARSRVIRAGQPDLHSLRIEASSVARILLAIVFLLSGISKLLSPHSAATFLQDIFPIQPYGARIIVTAISLAEIAAGCLLLLKRWVSTVAMISCFFFLSALAAGLFFLGTEKPCGCFGDFLPSQTDEWFVLRTLAFLLLSLVLLRSSTEQPFTSNKQTYE